MTFPAFDFNLMYVSIFHSLPMSPFMNIAINNMEQDWTVAGRDSMDSKTIY